MLLCSDILLFIYVPKHLLLHFHKNTHAIVILKKFLLIFRKRRRKYKKNLALEYASTTKVLDWKILTKRNRRKNNLNNFFREKEKFTKTIPPKNACIRSSSQFAQNIINSFLYPTLAGTHVVSSFTTTVLKVLSTRALPIFSGFTVRGRNWKMSKSYLSTNQNILRNETPLLCSSATHMYNVVECKSLPEKICRFLLKNGLLI